MVLGRRQLATTSGFEHTLPGTWGCIGTLRAAIDQHLAYIYAILVQASSSSVLGVCLVCVAQHVYGGISMHAACADAGADPSGAAWQAWTDQLVYGVLAGLVWGGAKLAVAEEEHARVMEAVGAYMAARPIKVCDATVNSCGRQPAVSLYCLAHGLHTWRCIPAQQSWSCCISCSSCTCSIATPPCLPPTLSACVCPAGECRAAAHVWCSQCC